MYLGVIWYVDCLSYFIVVQQWVAYFVLFDTNDVGYFLQTF